MPTEKYAHAPGDPRALPAHREAVRPLRQRAVPHRGHRPRVGRRRVRAGSSAPTAATSSPRSSSRMGTGPLHVPKLPGIPGIESFQGHSFHTSRWDYDYTGGDPSGAPMDQLADKRVAIIGTGATAVQCVPHLARACQELYVFQRTPSSVDVRDNRPTDPEWFAEIATPGWQQRWLENFTANQTGGTSSTRTWCMDGWTDLARRIRAQDHGAAARGLHAREDDGGLRGLRLREDGGDPRAGRHDRRGPGDGRRASRRGTASSASGRASTTSTCRRSTSPGTHLVDTDGKGVERITETGVVVAGVEYEVDCIIYASGFEVGTEHTRRAGFDLIGPRRRAAVGALGRRHAHASTASTCTASRTCSSCSRRRAPTSSRTSRTTSPRRARRSPRSIRHALDHGARRGRGDAGGRGRVARPAAHRVRG